MWWLSRVRHVSSDCGVISLNLCLSKCSVSRAFVLVSSYRAKFMLASGITCSPFVGMVTELSSRPN